MPTQNRLQGRHKKMRSRETIRWDRHFYRDADIPTRPAWMPSEMYLRLVRFRWGFEPNPTTKGGQRGQHK